MVGMGVLSHSILRDWVYAHRRVLDLKRSLNVSSVRNRYAISRQEDQW